MKKYKLIIFDLDGTLINSIEGIGSAMNSVLEKNGYPCHEKEQYYYFVGNGLKKLTERALPSDVFQKQEIQSYYKELLKEYETHYKVGLRLYDGIEQLLDYLEKEKYILAINTNKIDFMAKKIVKEYLSKWNFLDVWGAKEDIPIKPSPIASEKIIEKANVNKSEVLYIGDSEVDIQTAQNIGIDSVFVSWGFRTREDIKDKKITYSINQPKELMEILERNS